MKPGRVIGKVTLSQSGPALAGARWLVVSPMGKEELTGENPGGISTAATPIVYDNLGAGIGDTILYVEGAEATEPFPHPIPLDAINVAILDYWKFEPSKN